uniref:Protein MMS22-like n=1 Tax=Scleropages formosus TaxID=113540 RepID=A0A8C9TJ92_SCLFO
MEGDFSESLTPPVSPSIVETQCDRGMPRPPSFSCVSDLGQRTLHGYVGSGALKRLLLRLDPAPADYETDTVDLFGFSWVTETALVESTTLLFNLFRQTFLKLENLVKSSSHDIGHAVSNHFQAEELRQQCVLFLQYVKVYVSRYFAPPRGLEENSRHPYVALEEQFPSALLEQLFGITLLFGRLRDLPSNLQACLSLQHQGTRLPPAWHLLHLHLDVHWTVLELLHLLEEKMLGQVVYAQPLVNLTGENLTNVSLFEEHLGNLLMDLVGLAMTQYSKVRPTEALTTPHYHCTCTKELWVLLIHLLEHRSRVLHTQSFWSYMNTLLRTVLNGAQQGKVQEGHPTHCKDPLGFTWWLVTHLADLGQSSSNGTHQDEGTLQEEQLRMQLHCCLSLCLLWDSSISMVTTLWEYYSKNLNALFTVPWLAVSELSSVGRTPLSLLEQARSCCSLASRNPSLLRSTGYMQLYRSANSFQIFLRILAVHLSQGSGDGAPWRQIKGRVYSKFHQRRMLELSEGGLMNFLLLFLVLARMAEPEDVCVRACELLASRPSSSLSISQRMLLCRGQLAFVLLFQERGLDVAALADRLGTAFTQVAREFYLKTTEATRKLALWPLLGAYIEGVQEVLESSAHLHLSEEKLLNEGFGLLLPACRQSELNSALGFLQSALAQLRAYHCSIQTGQATSPLPSMTKECHLAVAAALWANFFPFLRSLRLSLTPPPQLADCAAGFSLLALDLPGSAPQDLQPFPTLSIMQCFGWDEMLHPLVVTRYLTHTLHNSALVSSVSSSSGSAQALSVRAWVRCVLQQHAHRGTDGSDSRPDRMISDHLTELTRLVFRLPEVESLLQKARLQSSVRQEPEPALRVFIKAVGFVYRDLQSLSERSTMVSQALDYIGDVLKHIKPYLANKSPSEGLQLAYRTVGYLVKQWSSLLATSKAQQLLFRIVDVLLLPHALFQQDKSLPSSVLCAVRDSLPLYLQGLSEAAGVSQTQGAYLKQQLRSITAHYLDRFLSATPTTGTISNHPILLAVCGASSGQKGAVLRSTVIQVENIAQSKSHGSSSRLASLLAFFVELLKRTSEPDPALVTLALPALLRCLLLATEPQGETMFPHLYLYSRCFVEDNIGLYEHQVYGVLEVVSVLDRSVVEGLIPMLSLSLRNTECKRGLGRNTILRNAYKKLLSNLGETGHAEIIRLDED